MIIYNDDLWNNLHKNDVISAWDLRKKNSIKFSFCYLNTKNTPEKQIELSWLNFFKNNLNWYLKQISKS